MSEHRHPRAITPPTGVISDAEMISRLNGQLLAANAALETVRARNRDLERKVAELMCWQVGAFVDGDLDAERADAFREHLDGCAKCRAEVLGLEQLKARLTTLEPTNG